MKKTLALSLSALVFSALCFFSFSNPAPTKPPGQPKLVVAVVIDQMRYEFLDRFYDKFGEGGFKKLLREGYNFRNTHYNYMHTETGPGHAAIYTGATPSVSGIIGNSWYDRSLKKYVNVVSGMEKHLSVGVRDSMDIGRAGPDRLLATTIGDELKIASQFRSKTITVSIKDRAAILAGGHTADGAYWFDPLTGRFITSTYYMKKLPGWVEGFNNNGLADSLNVQSWETSFPVDQYTESRPDDNKYERKLRRERNPTFPYDLKQLNPDTNSFFYLPYTPFGNELVARMAEAALVNEDLGKGPHTDLLGISFSSTDYAGHLFGPYSVEIEDIYIKLDQTIARLLAFLDRKVGKDNYVFVLSSDHGVTAIPFYLKDKKLPAGIFSTSGLASRITTLVRNEMGIDSIILHQDNMQLYLDKNRLKKPEQLQRTSQMIKTFLEKEEFVNSVYTREELLHYGNANFGPHTLLQNTFSPQRSGDIFMIPKPSWLGYSGRIATSHGTPYPYDTHVPLLWYGKGIPSGSSVRRIAITDIAPTLAFLCRVMIPSGSYGQPLEELFKTE